MQADSSLLQVIIGFAMHRSMRDLFVQTIRLNILGKVFNRRYFEIFFSFFQENRICTLCKLSPLHEMSNNKTNNHFFLFFFFFVVSELAQIVVIRYPRAPSIVSLSKYPRILVLVSTLEDAA